MLNDCLEPWFSMWTEECDAKLLTEEEKRGYTHFTDFDRNALIHTTLAQKATADAQLCNNGLRTADELARRDGLPAYEDGIGSIKRCPVNIAILHAAGKKPAVEISGIPQKQGDMPAPAGTPKPADKKSREGEGEKGGRGEKEFSPPFDCAPIQAVLRDAAERVYARLTKTMAAAARHPEDFGEWRTNNAPRHAEPVARFSARRSISAPCSRRRSQEPDPAAAIIDAWISSCGDPSKFTVATILELMQ